MNNRAQGLSISTIIIALVALVVLVVLIAIFTGVFSNVGEELTSCQSQGGTCFNNSVDIDKCVSITNTSDILSDFNVNEGQSNCNVAPDNRKLLSKRL